MNAHTRHPFDLARPADNGLRRGRTTGACATAAMKAALLYLLRGEAHAQVPVSLPDGNSFLLVPVERVVPQEDGSVRADVIKDAGDDPDNTHGATIFALVRQNGSGTIRFLAGPGVGIVTEPGIRVPTGEPAINPVPRQMMRWAVEEVLDGADNPGFDLEIGCENGEHIAKKTFNPRLGIVGGISILGTSGIVEPMSLAAYMASIEVYIRVALADAAPEIAYTPGKLGQEFARKQLGLPQKRLVQISNFLGFSLECAQQALEQEDRRLATLWVIGHPGKIAKALDEVWDTHSRKSAMAMGAVARVATECGFDSSTMHAIAGSNTVEAVMDLLRDEPRAPALWTEIERRAARLMHRKVPRADRVEVRLFSLNTVPLGQAA